MVYSYNINVVYQVLSKSIEEKKVYVNEEDAYLLGYNGLWFVKSQPTFQRTYRLNFQGRRINQTRNYK
jgi:hypothetical protein